MSYNVIALPRFEKDLKKLIRKYPSLKQDFADLLKSLKVHPQQGKAIGNHCYKIRLAIRSKGKGKSGGARIITYLQVSAVSVYLLTIYDKSTQENINDKDLQELLKWIP